MKPTFRVVTICNREPAEEYYCLDAFHKSLSKQGVVPLTLGAIPGQYTGLGSKPRLLLKAITEGWIKEKIIIFVDCFDLVFARQVTDMVDAFIETKADIIIGAEKTCFPVDLKDQFDAHAEIVKTESAFIYLNSGFIIGHTDAIKEALLAMDLDNEPDDHVREDGSHFHCNDQHIWQKLFCNVQKHSGIDMRLDMATDFCLNMHEVSLLATKELPPNADDEIKEDVMITDKGDIFNFKQVSFPYVLHWNGPAKTNGTMMPILKHLNLR